MSKADKETVLGLGLKDGQTESVTIKGKRHVISMSDSRAKKDAKDREKGIRSFEKRFASGKITKASVNNRGYNSFLTLEGETTVTIDSGRIAAETLLGGLKGFVTNRKISDGVVIENYRNLHFFYVDLFSQSIVCYYFPYVVQGKRCASCVYREQIKVFLYDFAMQYELKSETR